MADAVLAVSLRPRRIVPDGAIAIGANSLTMIETARSCGARCTAVRRARYAWPNERTEHSRRHVN